MIIKTFAVLGASILLISILYSVYLGGLNSIETQSISPLLKATGGKIFALELSLKNKVNELKDKNYNEIPKLDTFKLFLDFITLIVIFFFLYYLCMFIITRFQQPTLLIKISVFGITFSLFALLELLYCLIIEKKLIFPFISGFLYTIVSFFSYILK